MSPGRWALPSGMFSTSPQTPITLALALRVASVFIAPATAPAPPMSHFIDSMPSAGLIEMPPVSKVTPLPTRATGLAPALPPFQRITSSRGGRTEPWATPSSEPMPSVAICFSSSTSIDDAAALERGRDPFDEAFGINDIGGLGDQRAGEVEALEKGVEPRPFPAGVRTGADDDQLRQRHLLLARQFRAVAVVAPRAGRSAEGEARGLAAAEIEAGKVDDQPGLARHEQPRGERRAGPLEAAIGLGLVAQAEHEQPAHRVALGKEGLREPAKLAVEALRVGGPRGGDGGLAERREPRLERVVAAGRDGERIGALGTRRGEFDFDQAGVS